MSVEKEKTTAVKEQLAAVFIWMIKEGESPDKESESLKISAKLF